MNELALFAGVGGGILGGLLAGWRTVCAVEINAYCAQRLIQRQNEGYLPPFPIWDDVRTFDGRPWQGVVNVVSGGFPCQDISSANPRGAGIEGSRSGLWKEFRRIICEVEPGWVFVENSPNLVNRGIEVVLKDLAALGYDAEWGMLSAGECGAWHKRERLWIVATNVNGGAVRKQSGRRIEREDGEDSLRSSNDGEAGITPDVDSQRLQAGWSGRSDGVPPGEPQDDGAETQSGSDGARGSWWDVEPGLVRVVHGVPDRVERIRALGNAQVPIVAKCAWEKFKDMSRR